MDGLMNVSTGTIFWTIIAFLIFLYIIIKIGAKPILNGLKAREDKIIGEIKDAENANLEAKKLLAEAQAKIDNAQTEMGEIVAKGRQQAEQIIEKAKNEAEQVRKNKVDDALREIENQKQLAIGQLRSEVASLVVEATEKILGEKLDKEKHYKMVESYIEKLPKN